jgi:hypothetical protein
VLLFSLSLLSLLAVDEVEKVARPDDNFLMVAFS